MRLAALGFLAIAAMASTAWGQTAAPFNPQTMKGAWVASGVSEGDEACTLRFNAEMAIGGWGLQIPADCKRKFPLLKDAAAWNVAKDGSVVFVDPLRKTLLRFEPTADGDYVADPANGEPLALGRPVTGKPPTDQERMSGAWSLTGMGGDPKCSFNSIANAAGTAGKLVMKPGCAAVWKTKGWASWRLPKKTRLELLDAKGRVLQAFTLGDIVTYEGEDARGELIYWSRD